MDEIDRYVPQGAVTFLWVALVIGLLFIGLMAFDFIRRFRRDSKFRERSGGWRRSFSRPFRRAAELRAALKDLRRHRAERRKWEDSGPRRRRRR
jgi:hypothetical protein